MPDSKNTIEYCGSFYDRVTSVIGYFEPPSLVDWKIRVGKKESGMVSRKALGVGSNVDEWIKANVLGFGMVPKLKSVDAKNAVSGYKRFLADYSPTLLVGERFYDKEWGITGEPDLIWDGKIWDIKCAKHISDSYWIQIATYAKKLGLGVGGILRLDKDSDDYELSYAEKEGVDAEYGSTLFLGLLNAYRFYNRKEEKNGTSSD